MHTQAHHEWPRLVPQVADEDLLDDLPSSDAFAELVRMAVAKVLMPCWLTWLAGTYPCDGHDALVCWGQNVVMLIAI